MRRVVVTGLGAVTPIGNSASETWEAAKAGKCGIAPITHFDTTDRKVKVAGEVKDFNPELRLNKREIRKMDLFTQFAMYAAAEAMEDAGLVKVAKADAEDGKAVLNVEDQDRFGCILSSGIGGFETIEKEVIKGNEKGFDRISPYFIPMIIGNMAAGQVAIEYNLRGMCSCPVAACAGGTNAIGDAFHRIRDGYEDLMVAGGAEAAITQIGIGGFTSMKALNTTDDPNRASIPFDAERGGFVMGEGAGILILEEYEHAKRRGAKIYCEVVGYGATCDANHITAPLEDGSGAAKCMAMAVKDAGAELSDVDYINAHGTSTHLNDAGETKAIKLAFGEHAKDMMVSSSKSMTGHLLGASGAIEGVILALTVANDVVVPTINYKVPDPDCDLDIVPNEARQATVNYGLSNSLGFGGHNASILMKKCAE